VRTTPALGASFRVSPRLNVYANAGRGFETPTFAELAYRPGAAAGLNFALKPSTSLHRELGIKALTGDHGQLNAALFRIDTRDEIVVNSAAGGRSDFRNASGTRRSGLELAWQQRHAGGFESALAWTLLDARFRQPFVSGTPPLVVAAGNRLPGVAARQFYGELLWRYAVSGFHAGVELRHVGKVYVNDRNSESAAAYTIGNLRTGFMQRGRGWRFRIVTEVEIRTPLLANVQFLQRFVSQGPPPADDMDLVDRSMVRLQEAEAQRLLQDACSDEWTRARLLPALWYLVGTHQIGADLEKPPTMKTALWSKA
jgi:iron complex outermembrane receptor protein